MKITLDEALSILGIKSFTTQKWEMKNGKYREIYAKEFGDTKVLMMSNEFAKNGAGKPDPKEPIWITILENRSPEKYDYVMQFSNKAPKEGAVGQTYGEGV